MAEDSGGAPRGFGQVPGQKEEKKEKKGAGFLIFGEGSSVSNWGKAVIVGIAVLGLLGGGGIVLYRIQSSAQAVAPRPAGRAIPRRAGPRQRIMDQELNRPHENRRSSLGFVTQEDRNAPLPGVPAADGSVQGGAGAGTGPGAGDPGAVAAQGGSRRGGRGRPHSRSKPRLEERFSSRGFSSNGGFSGGRGLKLRTKLGKLDNPNLGGVNDFQGARGGKLRDFSGEARAHLMSKVSGKDIYAGKTMGQLKFAGRRSADARLGGSDNSQAAYARQAFSQEQRDRLDLENVMPTPDGVGSTGVAASGIAGEGQSYSNDTGQQVGYGASDSAYGCPEGMNPVPGGGCEPANVEGEDDTIYARLMANAWSLIRKARKATTHLDLWSATEYAARAEMLGDVIKEVYGQEMQGEIVRYWADRSNELNHWHLAKQRALEKRREKMDPNMNDDDLEDARDTRKAGYP